MAIEKKFNPANRVQVTDKKLSSKRLKNTHTITAGYGLTARTRKAMEDAVLGANHLEPGLEWFSDTTDIRNEYQLVLRETYHHTLQKCLELADELSCKDLKLVRSFQKSMIDLIRVGQAADVPPETLKKILNTNFQTDRSHRNWQRDEVKERNVGLLVGGSRLLKIS